MDSEKNLNNNIEFSIFPLGQTVLKYTVPLDVYNIINSIYETEYNRLAPANKQLIGKIKKEHSLYYNGDDTDKMQHHNLLPKHVLDWIDMVMDHYLIFNRIKEFTKKLSSVWVNQMYEHEYNPVHVHQGSIFTGLSSVMILKQPDSFGVEYSSAHTPTNGRLQILGNSTGQFASMDFQPTCNERDFYIFPYDVRHCVYPFNGNGTRRTLSANMDVKYDPILNRSAS